jgi:hypothetical protein
MRRTFFLAGLFLICMCVLMLQIIETRLLSVMTWYHLAFLAISTAMFGMTAGSLLVYFETGWFTARRLFEHLSWIGVAFAIAVVLSTLSITSSVLLSNTTIGLLILGWLKLILIILPPYVLAGMAISLALTRSPWPVGIVYGVDLIGAAAGCLIALALMTWLDGVSALFAIGTIGTVAAACFRFAWHTGDAPVVLELPISHWAVARHPVALALVLAGLTGVNAAIQPDGITLVLVKGQLEKPFPAAEQWNSYSRVRALPEITGTPILWGPSPRMPVFQISERTLNIDGDAGTTMYRFDGDLATLDFLKFDVTNLAYTIRHQGKSAVIGVGGGRDVLSAHLFGFPDVTGVELNPIFVDWLTNRFRAYNHLVDVPGTHLHVDEARGWFAGTTERFNLIEMSLIDTWAATGAGAFSHSENGLYTVQGWQHFFGALTPDGVLTVSRWYDPHDIAETGRLLSLAATTLRARGVADPETRIFLAGTRELATLIVGNAALSADDLARLHVATRELGFTELVSPDRDPSAPILGRILRARGLEELEALTHEYHIDFMAPTDDRPFFFNQLLLTDVESLRGARVAPDGVIRGNFVAIKTIGLVVVLSGMLVGLTMIMPSLPSLRRTKPSLALLGSTYFALIGLGFMFIEIGIIQRVSLFLGHPAYGLAVGLFSIILSTGIGSLVSERVKLDTSAKLLIWAGLLAIFVVILTFWFPALVAAFEGRSLAMRVLVSLGAIVPSGLLMGFGFPTGMRLVNRIDPKPTPWFWAVNGAAGVLAAGLAVGVSIAFSINASLWIGAGCYLLLSPVAVLLHRGAGAPVSRTAPLQPASA